MSNTKMRKNEDIRIRDLKNLFNLVAIAVRTMSMSISNNTLTKSYVKH